MAKPQDDQPSAKSTAPTCTAKESELPQPYRDAFADYDAAVRAIYAKGVAERKALGL
jgi:hypothetical protein